MKPSCYVIHLNNGLQSFKNAARQSCCVFSLMTTSIRNRGSNASVSPATVKSVVLCALKLGKQAVSLFASLCVRYVVGKPQARPTHRPSTGVGSSTTYDVATESHYSMFVGKFVLMTFLDAKKEVGRLRDLLHIWCPEEDSNLHTLRHTDLNRARLPIPPSGLHLQRRAI